MLRKTVFILLLTTFVADTRSEGQTNRLLSLSECIQLALLHNYDVQIERFAPEIARFNLDGSYGAYQPSFNASAVQRFINQAATFDPKKLGIDTPYELSTDELGLVITVLLTTGLCYDVCDTASLL